MKTINMKNENAMQKINEELDIIQAKSRVRTITAKDVKEWLEHVERTLSITKKALDGVKVIIDPNAQEFPSAYKYTPESTQFTATFKNGSWRIENIERARCGKIHCRIIHTEESRAAIIERFSSIA